jgi:hypothetical protein
MGSDHDQCVWGAPGQPVQSRSPDGDDSGAYQPVKATQARARLSGDHVAQLWFL